ncbi:MAG: DUF2953 domain-containing protein [Clostridia bacterium]|nr:DUF2953 domain-containing protein [Clostridia bacterium]
MKIGLIIFAVLVLLIVILLLIPIRLELEYKKDAVANKVTLDIKYMFFKLRLFEDKEKKKKKKSKAKQKKEKKSFSFETQKAKLEGYWDLFKSIKADAARILEYTASRAMVFDNVEFETEFGFSDAMHTGIFTGLLNGFVYGVLGFVHNHSTLRKMNVNIQPVFEKTCFDLHIRCILHLKNVHIIIVAVNVLKILRKIKKAEGSR